MDCPFWDFNPSRSKGNETTTSQVVLHSVVILRFWLNACFITEIPIL